MTTSHSVRRHNRAAQILAASAIAALAASLTGCSSDTTPQASAATTAPKATAKAKPADGSKKPGAADKAKAEPESLVPAIDKDPQQIKPLAHSEFKLPMPQEKIDANSSEDPYFGELSQQMVDVRNQIYELTNACMKERNQPFAEQPKMEFPKVIHLAPAEAGKTGYNSLYKWSLQDEKVAIEQAKKLEKKKVSEKIDFYEHLGGHTRGTWPLNASPRPGSCLGDAVIEAHGSIKKYEQRMQMVKKVEKKILEETFDSVRMRNKIARWQNCMLQEKYLAATPENNADFLVNATGTVPAAIKKQAKHDANCRIHTNMVAGWNKSLAESRAKFAPELRSLEALYGVSAEAEAPAGGAAKPAAPATKPAAPSENA